MKKRLFLGLAALAAVTLTSCQKDQVINQVPQQNAIEFGTYLGRDAQTKASVTDITTLRTGGFGVFAYYTAQTPFNETDGRSSNFMYNQKVYDPTPGESETKWSYSPIKYWPNNENDKISFFAYAPYVNTTSAIEVSGSNATAPTIKYTVNNDISKHIDLVYAPAHIDMTKQATSGKVSFNFFHALSRIGFNVEAMVDIVNTDKTGADDNNTDNGSIAEGTTITINSVKLSGNFIESGILNLASSTGTASIQNSSAISNPNWTDLTVNGKKTFELSTVKSNVAVTNVTTSLQQYNSAESYLMIIPQMFNDNNDNLSFASEF